jgi:hypothetical protein
MSIKSISPTVSGSFVYDGCYRARGDLSFAERAAWGLSSPAIHKVFTIVNTRSSAASPTPQRPHAQAQLRSGGMLLLRNSNNPARARWSYRWMARGLVQPMGRRTFTARVRGGAIRFKTVRWRRYRATVVGSTVTLLIANGKTFVTASAHSRRP